MKCDVCKENDSIGVACSACGAVSLAYCQRCLDENREPYGLVVASLYGFDSIDDVAEWYRPTVMATMQAENKSESELLADVQEFGKEYEDALEYE